MLKSQSWFRPLYNSYDNLNIMPSKEQVISLYNISVYICMYFSYKNTTKGNTCLMLNKTLHVI